ncbi:MAG TPA: alkaline phosphatase D family protein [Patescibacteria group bacterium]|nr:alkaline phosphatase D family protein [Patescibacteria group bacterium]
MALGTPYLVASANQSVGALSFPITVTSATTTGDAIVIGAGGGNANVNAVIDSQGNSYSKAASVTSGQKCSVWVALNTTALTTSDTITLTYSATGASNAAVILGCSGVATASAVDQVPTPTTGTSTSPSITTGTLSQANELCVAVFQDGNGGGAPSGFGSFTNLGTVHSGATSVWDTLAYQKVSSTTAVTASCTIVSSAWSALLITLKESNGPTPGSVVQSIAGAPTQTGFTVVSKLAGATSVRLKVATDAALTANATFVAAQVPDSMGYVRHTPTGLSYGTQYYYQLADTPSGGSETLIGSVGKAKTLKQAGVPANFTVALVSCITQAAADPAAINDWTTYNADLNVFTGDFDYSGTVSTTLATQVSVYETQIAGANGLSAMIANAWGYYCRSDHESGPDNGDSNTAYTATNIAAYQQVFPYGALGDTNPTPRGLYQTWVVGRVRFIMVDVRNLDRSPGANTDNASKTMLGATQLAWLKTQLIQPEPLKVIISDPQWAGTATPFLLTNGPDKWWSYNTERMDIVNYISTNASLVQNVMLWHGDAHCLGVVAPADNAWGGFPVYCAAPMHNTGGGLDLGSFTSEYNNSGGNCRFYGRITLTDDGTTITSVFSGWDATNQVQRVTQTDTFSAPPAGKGKVWNASTGTWDPFTPKIYASGVPDTAKAKVWDAGSGTWITTKP